MPKLTRRRFLAGAPTVAVAAAVGVAMAPKVMAVAPTENAMSAASTEKVAIQTRERSYDDLVGQYDIETDQIITPGMVAEYKVRRKARVAYLDQCQRRITRPT